MMCFNGKFRKEQEMHVSELMSLKGKIILVTGGAGIYGQPIFEALAEAGGTVITASRSTEKAQNIVTEFRTRGLDVHAMCVDQALHDSVMNLKLQIEKQFGGLDVFINNAVSRPMETYTDPLEMFAESMRVNAVGMFDIMREMADIIAKRGGGSIVNIASIYGVYGADFGMYEGTEMDAPPDYFFHKGGLITLTKYLARRLAAQKVRVNCISPGGFYDGQPESFVHRYTKKVPAGRMAGHDDIKGAVVFLASDASSYINGQNILMDGGMHC